MSVMVISRTHQFQEHKRSGGERYVSSVYTGAQVNYVPNEGSSGFNAVCWVEVVAIVTW